MKNKFLSHGRILGLLAVILFATVSCEDTLTQDPIQEKVLETENFAIQTQAFSEFTPLSSTNYCGAPLVATLYAGQNINAGSVTVGNDEDYVYVTYETVDGWLLSEVHVYAGSQSGLPANKKGNPTIGRFPVNETLESFSTTFTAVFPLESFDECFIVAAHAVVVKVVDGVIVENETGWGEGTRMSSGSWATYMDYCLQVCEDIVWNFPVWTQSISHVILVFETSSGYFSVKVDDFPDGYYDLNLLIDDMLAFLGYEAISLHGAVIKGGNQPALYFNASGEEINLPDGVGFYLNGQNVGNPSAIDYTVNFSDIF